MGDKTYRTISGDTWDSISFKIYGDSKKYDKLMDWNPNLCDFIFFPAGIKVKYQEISEKEVKNRNTPPWRK